MVNEFADWIIRELTGYLLAIGHFVEDPASRNQWVVVVRQLPSTRPNTDLRRAIFPVILLGPRGSRGSRGKVMEDANKLVEAVIRRDDVPCGAAHIISLGEAQGPGITAEDRVWASLDFELIF